jgi:hypothetical protein
LPWDAYQRNERCAHQRMPSAGRGARAQGPATLAELARTYDVGRARFGGESVNMEQDVTPEASYISETLYHFLPDDFGVFTSIVKNGLLCSVGNKGKLDRFAVTLQGEGVKQFDIWQHPRVCFTDIAKEHLGSHVKKYGKFGLGFSRETILRWGGSPVWYLNNHASPDGTSDGGNAILYQLLRFSNIVDHMMTLVKKQNQKLFVAGKLIDGQDAERYIYGAITSLFQMLSFVKEMSPHDRDKPVLFMT